jgi:hypothetical protein
MVFTDEQMIRLRQKAAADENFRAWAAGGEILRKAF